MKKKLHCVLLVDDDEANNYLSRMVLELAGVTDHIETAWNGLEALDYLTNRGKYAVNGDRYPKPALIFLDINMPIMNGWDFLEEYNKLDEIHKAEIIIVMLTTSLNPDDKTRADSIAEISGFQNKPLTREIIDGIMREFFPDYL